MGRREGILATRGRPVVAYLAPASKGRTGDPMTKLHKFAGNNKPWCLFFGECDAAVGYLLSQGVAPEKIWLALTDWPVIGGNLGIP